MSKNFKLFLIIFLLSLPFWWWFNVFQKNLEEFVLANEIEKNPPCLFIADIAKNYDYLNNLNISAKSALSVKIDGEANEKILFNRNSDTEAPIASLTKLMAGIIASEFYQLDSKVKISAKAVSQKGDFGNLKAGEILTVYDLLQIMLVESSNDAAVALAETIGLNGFTALMNLKTKDIGMINTFFFEPTGLDPEERGLDKENDKINFSTTNDLFKLAKYILKKPLILEILTENQTPLYLENGELHHILNNTNELLGKMPNIIGGKTGFTERAGGCLILILQCQNQGEYLINILLNSENRFDDMEKLVNYVNTKRQCY